MAGYTHAEDGKHHFRYSEICKVTPSNALKMAHEHLRPESRFESEAMKFGTERHESWSDEAKLTGKVPACFAELGARYIVEATHVEKEFASEIAPGIVIHSRPDIASVPAKAIVDFKTVVDGQNGFEANIAQYKRSKQTLFYSFQLGLHGMYINRAWYLCEVWNAARDEILCYRAVEQRFTMLETAGMRQWAVAKSAMLAAAIESISESSK